MPNPQATMVFHTTNIYQPQAALVAAFGAVSLTAIVESLGLIPVSDATVVEGSTGAKRTLVVDLPPEFVANETTVDAQKAALFGQFAGALNINAQVPVASDPIVIV